MSRKWGVILTISHTDDLDRRHAAKITFIPCQSEAAAESIGELMTEDYYNVRYLVVETE